jgi:hypothetical protein
MVELHGKRRIFLDVFGRVHLLWRPHGQLLNGTEAADAEDGCMSRMAINDMLRTLQRKHSNMQIRKKRLEFTVKLQTRADVQMLGSAISGRSPAVQELSTGQALLQGGLRLLLLESPGLVSAMTSFSAFEKALDDPKMNSALLPASASLSVSFKRLTHVPNVFDQLPLHLLAVAKVHGFEITRLDALAALRIISMNRNGSKMQAQLTSLQRLLDGEPMVELFCPHSKQPSESMVLKKPSWFKSTFEPRWLGSTFECAVCTASYSTNGSRFWCGKCRVYICCGCSLSIDELKDDLRFLKEEVDEVDSDDLSDGKLEKTISGIHKDSGLPCNKCQVTVSRAISKDKKEFERALRDVVPIHKTCSKCSEQIPLRRCTKYDRRFDLLKSPRAQCNRSSKGCGKNWYVCNTCNTRYCANCFEDEVTLECSPA